jgi:pilus assembly protein CpaE
VVDRDQSVRNRLAMQLGEHAVAFSTVSELEARLPATAAIVVFGPSCTDGGNMQDMEQLLRLRPDVGAVLVAEELTTDLFQRAMRIGVRDVLSAPVETSQLTDAVRRVAEGISQVAAAVQSPAAIAAQTPGELGQVITVFSTKGGAGKSVIATNLGVLLAQRSDKPVGLVDADLQFGVVAVMLGMAPAHTIIDAVNVMDRLDADLLKSLLIKHEPTGLYVLAAPIEPAFADSVSLPHMKRILEILASFCSHVIIDTPASFNDIVLGVLEEADDIVLMAGMDIPHIKNTKIGLQTLRLLHIPASKVKLTLNRANSKVKLDIADVERTLQMKADCLLPSDIAVPQSINKGVPIVVDAPRSGVSRNLERMADLFPAHAAEQTGGR